MSALGLDLVREVEIESSLEGLPTTKHLDFDKESTLKEFHIYQ